MAENNKDSLIKSVNSIRKMAFHFLSDVKIFETSLQSKYTNIDDDRIDNASSALDECLSSISEALESLNEAGFIFASSEDEEYEEEE